ncbi:MAG TPA: Asp-tRNA(Asn)/Glu-tRNA(Gln) amidotransferase subunit GatA [Candidatus Omnitrophota bacterium]|nr:Asp-tRNA(Asn)/Glu-tRNA(Gln) amidotransferase subunit GatA [Candidatus Omnitrophota bacterium]HPD85281.1 Asp-tRNA(Asn)/Glu-tRNA(Gln) amidotransferase subunit GatA [Candidatus Omnitrophota bacterium]HRZ04218.1 Asp-tRNA(Asn)/Glu-tRNA(Gln) amidotransferase subunit GatA [Candidatus Omnitrophota bacterium]
MKLNELTAHELLGLLKTKQATPEAIEKDISAAIEKSEKKVKAYVRLIEEKLSEKSTGGKLSGIPIAVKDNICIKDTPTTCASRILEGFRPPYNATVIEKLKGQELPLAGQTNMDEFAFGSSTENSCIGPTHNPWNLDCVPGGSSGGSAAAVAAHEAIWALGSDTGGSIRQPASFCGIVGVKPTYGRVSRYGLIAFASSLDQIGPLTKDVTDAALLLKVIAGHDQKDSTSADIPVPDFTSSLKKDVKNIKIAIPKEYFVSGINPEIKKIILEAIETLKKLGVSFHEVSLPHTEYAVATYYVIATAEASSNLARFDGVQYGLRSQPQALRKTPLIDMFEETREKGFGNEAKRRIMLGTYALSSGYYDAYYLRGQKVRTLIKNDFDKVFEEFDAVLTPTSPTTAFKIGERASDPLSMYLSDVYTISANLAGIPAISLPCGFSKDHLPVGLQIMTKPFDEEMMFRVAYAYEQATDWHKKKVSL